MPKHPFCRHKYVQMRQKCWQSRKCKMQTSLKKCFSLRADNASSQLNIRKHSEMSRRRALRNFGIPYFFLQKITTILVLTFYYKITRVHHIKQQDSPQEVSFPQSCMYKTSSNSSFFCRISFSNECTSHVRELANSQNTSVWVQKSRPRIISMN